MNLTNYHSHCSFCDGRAPMEEFVKAAIESGFTAYGISSHAPISFPSKWAMKEERLSEYLNEFARLKAKYSGQIEFYSALEIDYLDNLNSPNAARFANIELDYKIGAVHFVKTDDGVIIDTDGGLDSFKLNLERYVGGDLTKIIKLYYKAMMELTEGGGVDFIAHSDKIHFVAESIQPGISSEVWYNQLRNDLFAFIAERDLILEINTKAFDTKGVFFPSANQFKQIKQLGMRVVVNSDAHYPNLINAGRKAGLEALKAAGINEVQEFHNGSWVATEITL
ncbi:MAG: histidinol-phosphatase [Rikenellaceae bacterium]